MQEFGGGVAEGRWFSNHTLSFEVVVVGEFHGIGSSRSER